MCARAHLLPLLLLAACSDRRWSDDSDNCTTQSCDDDFEERCRPPINACYRVEQ